MPIIINLFPLDASPGQLTFLGVFTFVSGFVAGMVGVALGAIRPPVLLVMGFNPMIAAGSESWGSHFWWSSGIVAALAGPLLAASTPIVAARVISAFPN
jgi:hypothetical protein